MNRSRIPWLVNPDGTPGYTWSPTSGCSPVSAGCDNCWARAYLRRFGHPRGGEAYPHDGPERVHLHHHKLDAPLRLRKPSVIGVCPLGDLFHEDVPTEFIRFVFARFSPFHTWILLTKRVERLRQVLRTYQTFPTLWVGTSVEDQTTADARIPVLLDTPAAHRFVSLEPQIGAVDLEAYLPRKADCDGCGWADAGGCDFCHPESTIDRDGLDLVITGAESGPKRRAFDPMWARTTRDQCRGAGTLWYYKQAPGPDRKIDDHPTLDGVEHRSLPWTL